MTSSQPSSYKQGYHHAVTANHKIRTAELDGAFLLPYLKPHFHILDVGCGPGSITTSFAKYVLEGSVIGVDLSDEIIDQAKEHLNSHDPRPSNVKFEVGNVVEGLQQFQDGTFDVVFCNQTLLHIPEPVKALKEMRRVCKKGGLVACREGIWPFRYYPELPGFAVFLKFFWLFIHGPPTNSSPSSSSAPAAWSDTILGSGPYPSNHRSGSYVHVWARQAGFDPAKIKKGAGVHTLATPEERKFLAGVMVGRIEQAGHREKFLDLGATKEEVDEMVRAWREWEEDVDGWVANVNSEVVCWN
ncbi:S-adenosyl-L-methionine-dependent methyltransferase [Cucurbitaria berberidis CBS 394.84]|uniref:S-adenosyl-L-methionine-dependent methyltransferase n=1 Tax=Cucurbitaria berberidis CBS 394.84 TaxID=1168544 RepID=A0A9P4LE97_9PLEO|nr:S-adenosyl-L-methionine-dependent methyltransferase [Cucurbitaria berberidis CBS 394.84]KAF1851825.1 S-adenosyl-L-methionine-dependent methyltransferase [Cucurbitaria berberidis CBS 394.84]